MKGIQKDDFEDLKDTFIQPDYSAFQIQENNLQKSQNQEMNDSQIPLQIKQKVGSPRSFFETEMEETQQSDQKQKRLKTSSESENQLAYENAKFSDEDEEQKKNKSNESGSESSSSSDSSSSSMSSQSKQDLKTLIYLPSQLQSKFFQNNQKIFDDLIEQLNKLNHLQKQQKKDNKEIQLFEKQLRILLDHIVSECKKQNQFDQMYQSLKEFSFIIHQIFYKEITQQVQDSEIVKKKLKVDTDLIQGLFKYLIANIINNYNFNLTCYIIKCFEDFQKGLSEDILNSKSTIKGNSEYDFFKFFIFKCLYSKQLAWKEYNKIILRYINFTIIFQQKLSTRQNIFEIDSLAVESSQSQHFKETAQNFVKEKIEQSIEKYEIKMLNEIIFPVIFNLTFQSSQETGRKSIIDEVGLFEIYCMDNTHFVDILLVFGTPLSIQKFIQNINQNTYKNLIIFSPQSIMKMMGLAFSDQSDDDKLGCMPYIYQTHLFQIIRAVSRKYAQLAIQGNMQDKFQSLTTEIIENIFYGLKHRFGIIQSVQSESNINISIYQLQNLFPVFNGISEIMIDILQILNDEKLKQKYEDQIKNSFKESLKQIEANINKLIDNQNNDTTCKYLNELKNKFQNSFKSVILSQQLNLSQKQIEKEMQDFEINQKMEQ